MEKEFVPYELAVKLKELGFDEPCFGRYDGRGKHKGKIWYEMSNSGQDYIPVGDVLAPTFSQAFRWLMQFPQIKKYRYNIALYPDGTYSLKDGKDSIYEYLSGDDCIDKLIEIVENK
jgi:hypothetical protein